jgi:uncharacterized protein (TIGR02284 family)
MTNIEIIDVLKSLCNLDKDAIQAYDISLKNIANQDINSRIQKFKEDHQRHVDTLSDLIKSLGGTPPSGAGDIRGMFMSGLSAIQGLGGDEGALKGLQNGEKVTNKSYKDALTHDLPQDVFNIVNKNYEDEKIHLEYINATLESRVWENRKAA